MRPTLLVCLVLSITAAALAQDTGSPVTARESRGNTRPAASRIVNRVDPARTRALPGQIHHMAQARFDQGAVDPNMPMEYLLLMVQPSAAQQADLDRLLADQQNPSSPLYHQWLTPEAYGDRFGLTSSDLSKVVGWLASEGFAVNQNARGRNWIAFSGRAGQVSKSLHTEIHRFQVGGDRKSVV